MGRKESWFSSVKKALSPNSKEKKAKKAEKLKNKLLGKDQPSASEIPNAEPIEVSYPHPLPPLEDVKLTEVESEQIKHVAIAAAAEVPAAVVPAAVEVVRTIKVTQYTGKSDEEVAAIKVQTAFRGYLARRAFRALKGLVRLKSLVDGPTAKRQTANTLKCMQNLSRVHSQIQSRRIRMSEENRTLQRQMLQKRAQELESLRMGEEWDASLQSKEQIEASLLQKYEAGMRRERALAYSYTHQKTWKRSAKSTNLLFMDPTNPHWGWSWLERWMAARPWESLTNTTNHKDAIKSTGGEITKSFARHQLNSDNPSSPTSQKPVSSPIIARKLNLSSPKVSQDSDLVSQLSVQSGMHRRHSIAGSSVRDDESLTSSPSIPSYMAPTRSAKAKSRVPSPLGIENGNTPEKGSSGMVKKQLSYPPSPARIARRHSGPPKVETSSVVNEVLIN